MRNPFGMMILAMLIAIPTCSWAQVADQDQDKPREDVSGREEYWRMRHADAHGQIPPNALVRAKEQMDQLRKAQGLTQAPGLRVSDAGISGWEWLGPGNIGGRIRAILVHPTNPNTLWVGSVSGGMWRSDNGGASWYPVDDFMTNLAITSIVMDPTNNSIMYAATGEGFSNNDGRQGAGIFKSVDQGVTWAQLPFTATADFYWVGRIAHHPTTPGLLLAATSTGVWRSTDGGAYWAKTLAAGALDVEFYSSGLAIAGGNPGVWTSSDSGKTWRQETTGAPNKLPNNGGRCEVACAPSAFQTFYVSMDRNQGEIWRSTDGGLTWTLQNTGNRYLSQGKYANALWVDPTNSEVIVVGGLDLRRSSNGGKDLDNISNWECFPDCAGAIHSAHADQHTIVASFGYNGTTNRKVFVGNDGGIQYTNDIYAAGNGGFGDGWAYSYTNLGITQFYGGAAAPDGSLFVGGAQDNGEPRLRSLAGPNNWTSLYSFGDGTYAAVDPSNTNRVYGAYHNLFIKRSDDGGGGYSDKVNGLGDAQDPYRSLWAAPFTMDPSNPATLYAGGKRLWKTTDHADNWSQVRDSIPSREACSVIAVAPSNPNIVWVGYDKGTVSVGTFNGSTWTWNDVGLKDGLPATLVTDIAINPTSAGEAFVTFGGYDINTIHYTTNYGASWQPRRGTGDWSIPAVQINTVRYHPLNTDWIYVGTDLGVLASEDHGLTWKVMPLDGTSEGPANVAVFQLFWQGSQYLCAATHGRGMYRARILPSVYVDINNGGLQDGTQAHPYRQIQDGINAAGVGSTIAIEPGDYPQTPLTFSRRGKVVAPAGGVTIH